MIASQQYALVADYNWIVENFDYGNSNFAGQQLGGKIGIVKDPFGTPIDLKPTPIPSVVNGQTVTSYASKLGAQPTKINRIGSEAIGWIYGMAAPEISIQAEEDKPKRRTMIIADISGGLTPEPEIIKPENYQGSAEYDGYEMPMTDEEIAKFRQRLIDHGVSVDGPEISYEEYLEYLKNKKADTGENEPNLEFINGSVSVAEVSEPDNSQNIPDYMLKVFKDSNNQLQRGRLGILLS